MRGRDPDYGFVKIGRVAEPQAEVTNEPKTARPASFSLSALIEAARSEASRIEAAQAALVASGDREEPSPAQMERCWMFEAMASILERCKANSVIVGELKKGR